MPAEKDATLEVEGVSGDATGDAGVNPDVIDGEEEENQRQRLNPENDPKMALMNSIANRVNQERQEDFVEFDDDGHPIDEPVQLAQDEPEEDEGLEGDEESSTSNEDQHGEPAAPKKQTKVLVVDGEEKEFDLETLVDYGTRTLQKELAADKRLNEATRILNEAKEKERRAQQTAPSIDNNTTNNTQKEDVSDNEPDFQAMTDAIRFGDDDEAVKVFEDLYKRAEKGRTNGATPGLSVDAIKDEVKRSLIEEKVQENLTRIRTNFQAPVDKGGFEDLHNDEDAMVMVRSRIDRALADGKPNSWETYQEAGNQVRSRLFGTTGVSKNKGSVKVDEATLQKRVQDKKNLDVVNRATAKINRSPNSQTPMTEAEARKLAFIQTQKSRGQGGR